MYKLQKHRVEEKSLFSDDKGEKPCQFANPETPTCLPTDAVAAGIAEPTPDIIVPPEGGCGSGSPVETGGAPGAASKEPLANEVVPRESSEVELGDLPIVESAATEADAGAGAAVDKPDIVVPPERGGGLGLPSVEAVASGAATNEHVPDLPSVQPDAPGSGGDDSAETDTRDLKSATIAYMARNVLQRLRIQFGDSQDQLLEATITTKDQPACFVVSCILLDKLKHCNWRVVQSHQQGERSYVYVRLIHAELVRFHGKMYGWGEARATFCGVHTVLPLQPDPMDAYPVVQLP